MNYPYIDFHTHKPKKTDTHICIQSLLLDEFQKENFLFPFTLGVHPWWVDEISKVDFFEIYEKLSNHPNYLGLGEIGLDRTRVENWQKQIELFEFQLKLANDYNESFIIIHCVRAFNEVIKYIKKDNYKGEVIFHDYHGNESITKDFIKRDYYFSLGKKLLHESEHFHKSIELIPLDRLFIESDDNEGIEVELIYEKLANLKSISIIELKEHIYKNLIRIMPGTKHFNR